MIRLVYLTDYSEMYSYRLLKGIVAYSKTHEPWAVSRIPSSYKHAVGFHRLVEQARRWNADAVIGQFEPDDDVEIFARYGITAYAQDHIRRFSTIPNISGDYIPTGRHAADFYVGKGFRSFAFLGAKGRVWSDERGAGFYGRLHELGLARSFSRYDEDLSRLNSYFDRGPLLAWLQSLPTSTAVLACDDTMANRLLDICLLHGISVPSHIAVLGVDNDEIISTLTTPQLSSISLDVESAGMELASVLSRHIAEGRRSPLPDILVRHAHIFDRTSTDYFDSHDPHLHKVMEYIRNHLTADISVSDLVRLVPLSRRLLEIRFKEATSQSIYQYIFNSRLQLFAGKLLSTDHPIGVLCDSSGLGDLKNVSRQFKARYGMTPSAYRRVHSPTPLILT